MIKFKSLFKTVALMVVIMIGLITILGKTPTPDPNSCPDLSLDILRQPSAAMVWEWAPSSGSYHWGMIARSIYEKFMNVGFVPNAGWQVLNDSNGLVFDMAMSNTFNVGMPASPFGVVYVMEYTLPAAPACVVDVTWDTFLSITLPNGLCYDDPNTTICNTSLDVVNAHFQLITLNDPTGIMGVSGSGRPLLENAIATKLGEPVDMRDLLFLTSSTSSQQRKSRSFSDSFTVQPGVQSHIYVGVAVMFRMGGSAGSLCLSKCYSDPDDKLADHGVFRVEGGTDGVIGISMTPVTQ